MFLIHYRVKSYIKILQLVLERYRIISSKEDILSYLEKNPIRIIIELENLVDGFRDR